MHHVIEDHSQWLTIGRINLSQPEIFLPHANFVDGKFFRSSEAKKGIEGQIDVYNPATAEIICQVPNSSKNDVDIVKYFLFLELTA